MIFLWQKLLFLEKEKIPWGGWGEGCYYPSLKVDMCLGGQWSNLAYQGLFGLSLSILILAHGGWAARGHTVQVVPASSPEAVVPLNTSWTDYVHRHHRPRSRHASPNMLSLPSLNANLLVYDKYAVCKFEKKRALWTN